MTQPPLGTRKLAQVGIVVADVEAAARAWSTLLGLPMPEIRITDEYELAQTAYEGAPTAARARLAFLHLDQLDIELLEPIGAPSTWNDQLERHGTSLHHLAFEIAGMQEKREYVTGQGMPLLQRGEYVGGRYAYFDSQSRLGAVLELLEQDDAVQGVDQAVS